MLGRGGDTHAGAGRRHPCWGGAARFARRSADCVAWAESTPRGHLPFRHKRRVAGLAADGELEHLTAGRCLPYVVGHDLAFVSFVNFVVKEHTARRAVRSEPSANCQFSGRLRRCRSPSPPDRLVQRVERSNKSKPREQRRESILRSLRCLLFRLAFRGDRRHEDSHQYTTNDGSQVSQCFALAAAAARRLPSLGAPRPVLRIPNSHTPGDGCCVTRTEVRNRYESKKNSPLPFASLGTIQLPVRLLVPIHR